MKKTFRQYITEQLVINGKSLDDIIITFRGSKDISWYLQGGCYDFAYGLGTFLEHTKGVNKVEYMTYGSLSEPEIHVAIVVEKTPYDVLGEAPNLKEIIERGDFYFDTKKEAKWSKINKKKLSIDINEANKISKKFIDISNKK
jgi:hypothetical protein